MGGVTDAYTYSTFGELDTYQASYNSSPLLNSTYARDALGRITQKVETIGGATTTTAYGYDTAGRLTDVTVDGVLTAHYAYDGNGNRLSVTRPVSGTVSGIYDAQDRVTTYGAIAYTYTSNGDLLTATSGGETTTYAYDVFGNLTAVTLPSGTQIAYVIDGQHRRIGKKVNGVLTQGFLYGSQLRPAAELDGSGAVVARFVYGTRINVPDYMVKRRRHLPPLDRPPRVRQARGQHDHGSHCPTDGLRRVRPGHPGHRPPASNPSASPGGCTIPTPSSCASAPETTMRSRDGGRRRIRLGLRVGIRIFTVTSGEILAVSLIRSEKTFVCRGTWALAG